MLTVLAHLQILLLHIGAFRLEHKTCNLEIGEAQPLGLTQQLRSNGLQRIMSLQFFLHIDNVLQLADEPRVYLRQLINALYGIPFFQSLCHGENTQIRRVGELFVQLFEMHVVIAHKTVHPLAYHTQTFLDNLFERAADRHDFTYRFHARTDVTRHALEFRQVPTWYLANQIVQRRSHVC